MRTVNPRRGGVYVVGHQQDARRWAWTLLLALAFCTTFVPTYVAGAAVPSMSEVGAKSVPAFFSAAGRVWPLFFEGGAEEELSIAIVTDLDRVYSRFEQVRIVEVTKPREFQVEGEWRAAARYLDFSTNRDYWVPEPSRRDLGYLVERQGSPHVVIPQALRETYAEALRFKKAHALEFRDLERFISRLNTLATAGDLEGEELLEIFYLGHLTPDQALRVRQSAQGHGNPFAGWDVQVPSLLEMMRGEDKDEARGFLIARAVVMDKEEGRARKLPLIYDEKQWKVAFLFGE